MTQFIAVTAYQNVELTKIKMKATRRGPHSLLVIKSTTEQDGEKLQDELVSLFRCQSPVIYAAITPKLSDDFRWRDRGQNFTYNCHFMQQNNNSQKSVAQGICPVMPLSLRLQSTYVSALTNETLYKSVPKWAADLQAVKGKSQKRSRYLYRRNWEIKNVKTFH